jgi:protein TIF31
VEFPRPVPIVESIPDIISEPQVQSYTAESPSSASVLLEDIDKAGDSNKEVKTSALEMNEDGTVRVGSESIKDGNLNFPGTNNAVNEPNQNVGSNSSTNSSEMNMDDEKTFSILIRGRRNRKQTLRMPISLLTRPHGSQSFKVIYNRVVRGNDSSRSINFSSNKHCTASA